nr:excinuclease ABC subunit UvrC [Candidatus Njordarchaeota archaeon]
MDVEKLTEGIPESLGVYVMKDTKGDVIYVGKANNVRKRVLSHFRHFEDKKDLTLSSITSSVEFITTPTEVEALLLENNLIKKHKPRYNIRLRDDKTYPFLKLSVKEKFPFVDIVRRIVDDGSIYFGPMGDVGGARATLKIIRRVFPIRNCDRSIREDMKKQKPCLDYQLKQCSAPCAGLIGEEEYKALVEGARKILSGEQDELTDEFKRKMVEASEKLQFEKAAFYRDRIRDIEKTTLKQVMVFPQKISKDILAVAKKGDDACIQLLMIRAGKLIDQAHYFLEGVGGSSDEQILSAFTNQHYHYGAPSSIPPEIVVQEELEDKELLQRSLTEKRRRSPEGASTTAVEIVTPVSEEDSKLVQMANRNAEAYLEQSLSQEERRKIRAEEALAELKTILKLPKLPSRIEAFDVSSAGGEAAVGSAVTMVNGEPAKSMYRRFKIKTVQGQDDFAMMKEIVRRRYRRLTQQEEEKTPLPNLVLIDGGKGQLNAALEAQDELGIRIPTIGLAKEFDDVYVPYQPEPIDIPKDSKAILLLKRARDEAHRFAVSYHRKKMRKKTLESVLDTVPGIGPRRKRALMQYLDSIEVIGTADEERISTILKVNRETARKLRQHIEHLIKGK